MRFNKRRVSLIFCVLVLSAGLIMIPSVTVPVQAANPTGTFNIGTGKWTSGSSSQCTWADKQQANAGLTGKKLTVKNGADITVTGTATETCIEVFGTASITLSNANISGYRYNYTTWSYDYGTQYYTDSYNPIKLAPGAKLTLTILGTNTLDGEPASGPGIAVDAAELIIEGTGNLTTGGYQTGIGGGDSGVIGGAVTINSGTVTANPPYTSSALNAGIGGRISSVTVNGGKLIAPYGIESHNMSSTDCKININGGTVDASGDGSVYNSNGHITSSGTVTIKNGVVKANSIYGDTVIISGGTVTADASFGGKIITITGGAVTATGGNGSAGISISEGGTLTISGGTVTATGTVNGSNARSAGAGISATGGAAVITGGTVTAIGGNGHNGAYGGAGIGGNSYGRNGGNVTINGGLVYAQGGGFAMDIGCGGGDSSSSDSGTLTMNGNGILIAAGSGSGRGQVDTGRITKGLLLLTSGYSGEQSRVYGAFELAQDVTLGNLVEYSAYIKIPDGASLKIPSGRTLTVSEIFSLTVYAEQGGSVVNNGTVNNYGDIEFYNPNLGTIVMNGGAITNSGTVNNSGQIFVFQGYYTGNRVNNISGGTFVNVPAGVGIATNGSNTITSLICYNNSYSYPPPEVIIAFYNGEILIDMAVEYAPVNSTDVNIPIPGNANKIKVMLWQNAESLSSLRRARTVNKTGGTWPLTATE